MIPLDLRPYGIEATLAESSKQADFVSYTVSPGKHYTVSTGGAAKLFVIDGTRYDVLETLGSGTFGTTYRAKSTTGPEIAIKLIKKLFTDDKKHAFISESIMQIVLAEASKGEVNGPYVPTVFKVALNEANGFGYICSELMRNTLNSLIKAYTPADNDVVIPDALKKISNVLTFFYKKFKFNHRDLKSDNVMYVRVGTERIFKLIDFGFSCLTIPTSGNPLQIKGGDYFDESATCFKIDRDLSQLMYGIVKYCKTLSDPLKKRLSDMLIANVKRHTCRMADGCPKDKLEEWVDSYNFLNRRNVHLPFGSPHRVQEQMALFQSGAPFNRAILKPKPKPCPPGTTKHPRTGRCVKDGGLAWRSFHPYDILDVPCKEGKERNPVTRRCIKKCPPGTKRVDGTRRCAKQKLNPALPPVSEGVESIFSALPI
jgi:serine/threonine protein kinase